MSFLHHWDYEYIYKHINKNHTLKKHKRPVKRKKGGQIKRKARGKPRGVGKALRGYGAVSR